MKKHLHTVLALVFVLASAINIHAQTAGDFRSKGSGNWGDITTWESYDGSAWADAVTAPSGGSGAVEIQAGHTVTVASALTVNGTAVIVNGYLKETAAITKTTGTWVFNSGSTYELAKAPASNQGIPTATWNDGSTCIVTGVTSSTTGINAAQNFYNFTWNCDGQTGNLNLAWGVNGGARGDFSVLNSGNTAGTISGIQIRFGGGSGTVNIGGNLIVNGAKALLSFAGGGTAVTVNVSGNINVLAGALSMSNASGMVGTLNLSGNFTLSNGALFGKSNAANLSKLYFKKTGTQTVTIGSSGVFSNAPSFQVESGSIVNLGTSVVGGTGSFVVSSGGTLGIGHANGLNGNITATGASGGGNSFNTAGNYIYNGSAAQITGTLLPATVNNLTVNNSAGVTLSQNTTVNGTITLQSGNFDNSVNSITLGPSAVVSITGGTSSVALPVELTSFTASVRGKKVELLWNTATEVNNAGFSIERRTSSGAWSSVGFVEGNGTVNTPKSYHYTDNLSSAAAYQYRLKQIDRDGKFEYSSVIDAVVGMTADDFQLSQNYPNPFNPSTSFTFAVRSPEHVTVKVFNLIGQEVATLFNDAAQPNQVYTMKFDGTKLSSGIYIYSLRSGTRNETRKMILNK